MERIFICEIFSVMMNNTKQNHNAFSSLVDVIEVSVLFSSPDPSFTQTLLVNKVHAQSMCFLFSMIESADLNTFCKL